jgi:hypothetical protein
MVSSKLKSNPAKVLLKCVLLSQYTILKHTNDRAMNDPEIFALKDEHIHSWNYSVVGIWNKGQV